MSFAWQAQYKRHVHQSSEVRALISWEGLHFRAPDLQVCWDDFAWQVQHFLLLRITFTWQAQYFRYMDWKNRKTHWREAVSSALNFRFLKEVSQNCFVFVVVNFENWGSLAEFLRFWRCRVQDLRKSRRIAAFLMLSSSKIQEVSQNSFVFKLADRQTDRQTDRQIDSSIAERQKDKQIDRQLQLHYTTLHLQLQLQLHFIYFNYTSTKRTTATSTTTTSTTLQLQLQPQLHLNYNYYNYNYKCHYNYNCNN